MVRCCCCLLFFQMDIHCPHFPCCGFPYSVSFLHRYEEVQAPLEEATNGAAAGLNTSGANAGGSSSVSQSGPLPNPWAPQQQQAPPPATAAASTSRAGGPGGVGGFMGAVPPPPSFPMTNSPFGGGATGQQQQAMQQMLSNPMVIESYLLVVFAVASSDFLSSMRPLFVHGVTVLFVAKCFIRERVSVCEQCETDTLSSFHYLPRPHHFSFSSSYR